VGKALLLEYYEELPQPGSGGKNRPVREARMQAGLDRFRKNVRGRYTEGTLMRLLDSPVPKARRAAVLALGLVGTINSSNKSVAAALRDEDRIVRQLASDALWSIWFRAGNEANDRELRRLIQIADPKSAVAGLDALIGRCPKFAEAYNQRATLHCRLGDYSRSIADCARALKLNSCHFGALSVMGQCFMKLKKPRAALKSFRGALAINPNLDGVEETIHFLENALGEEGRKDDKK
jgi:tetratricopeptide (TPR) repeat protein